MPSTTFNQNLPYKFSARIMEIADVSVTLERSSDFILRRKFFNDHFSLRACAYVRVHTRMMRVRILYLLYIIYLSK